MQQLNPSCRGRPTLTLPEILPLALRQLGSTKRCHLIFDYTSCVSWWISTLLVPTETWLNAPQFTYLVVLNQLYDVTTTSHWTSWKFALVYMKHAEFVFEDKICIENLWECKRSFARRLLKEFLNVADILNTSYNKNCSLISHTDSFLCRVMKYCDNWLQNVLFMWF